MPCDIKIAFFILDILIIILAGISCFSFYQGWDIKRKMKKNYND